MACKSVIQDGIDSGIDKPMQCAEVLIEQKNLHQIVLQKLQYYCKVKWVVMCERKHWDRWQRGGKNSYQ